MFHKSWSGLLPSSGFSDSSFSLITYALHLLCLSNATPFTSRSLSCANGLALSHGLFSLYLRSSSKLFSLQVWGVWFYYAIIWHLLLPSFWRFSAPPTARCYSHTCCYPYDASTRFPAQGCFHSHSRSHTRHIGHFLFLEILFIVSNRFINEMWFTMAFSWLDFI